MFGALGIAVELRTLTCIELWFKFLTTWGGRALWYLLLGILTFHDAGVDLVLSIIVLVAAALFLVASAFRGKARAICDRAVEV